MFWHFLWIVLALFGALIVGIIICMLTPEQARWDMAAGSMQMEGYTDFEIELELGPRPEK